MQVYKSVSQLRSAEFTRTGLFSTEEVFAFARASSDDLGNSLIVVMNVMEREVSVSLTDLSLEMGVPFKGQVLVRSSGDVTFRIRSVSSQSNNYTIRTC